MWVIALCVFYLYIYNYFYKMQIYYIFSKWQVLSIFFIKKIFNTPVDTPFPPLFALSTWHLSPPFRSLSKSRKSTLFFLFFPILVAPPFC